MKNHLYSLYQMILQSLTFYLGVDQEKKRAGRPPKVSDFQLCALFILLVMVVCDSEGIVYDLWFHSASYHEVRFAKVRNKRA